MPKSLATLAFIDVPPPSPNSTPAARLESFAAARIEITRRDAYAAGARDGSGSWFLRGTLATLGILAALIAAGVFSINI